tara:strand:- start:1568 stop:1939 length:372 start_codon:yes stop_codon:yes gene_type:complete
MTSIIRNIGFAATLLAMTSSLALAQDRPIAGANCENPAVPSISSNAGNNIDMLLDAQDAVQSYMAASNDFITCVENVMSRRDGNIGQDLANQWTALINANVDAQEAVAAAFNAQVQIYQAAND